MLCPKEMQKMKERHIHERGFSGRSNPEPISGPVAGTELGAACVVSVDPKPEVVWWSRAGLQNTLRTSAVRGLTPRVAECLLGLRGDHPH